MNNLTIKELPISERPYEKCMLYGPEVLSDAELLAVILRNGDRNHTSVELATMILNGHPVHKGLIGLHYLSIKQLMNFKGIGKVKAIELVCICEIARRISTMTHKPLISFTSPESVANYFMESMRYLTREEIHMLMFDGKHQLIDEVYLAKGTINQASTSPREIFVEALKAEASFIIIVHNHPSGNPTPSKDDITFTHSVKKVGDLIGIKLSDHIIIGDNIYISLCERGLM